MGRIERGAANITLEMLYQLAKVLDCEAKELLP
jgi:transcriptional regulator with XRE-family HTH domain